MTAGGSLSLAGVEESEVFEFSDYLWAALMKSTEVNTSNCPFPSYNLNVFDAYFVTESW